MNRIGELESLSDLESYRSVSRRWRDDVSNRLVGRGSTSSARYQDNLFEANACPPSALVALGEYNRANRGEVEAYIYRMFEEKVSAVKDILTFIRAATTLNFDLEELIEKFESHPGLKRSIDKVFEITVYALFSTVVRALRLQVQLKIGNPDSSLVGAFGDFLETVVGIPKNSTEVTIPARLFRLGSTNAADRGLDMIANFGPAIQVKHLTLDAEAIGDICDGITADRIVVVCKSTEVKVLDSIVKQLGLQDRLQALITLNDLTRWYTICFSPEYRDNLGVSLLKDFVREFTEEFPSLDGLDSFLNERGYNRISLSSSWAI